MQHGRQIEKNAATGGGDPGQITQKLQAVAEALLGVEQDAAAVEGLALPERLGEVAIVRAMLGGVPASLEVFQAREKIAVEQFEERKIEAGVGVAGMGGENLFVEGAGLGIAAEQVQGVGESVGGVGVAGLEGESLLAGLAGEIEAVEPEQGMAEVGVVDGRIAAVDDGAADEANGAVRIPGLEGEKAEQMQGVGVMRASGKNLTVKSFGGGAVAGPMMCEGLVEDFLLVLDERLGRGCWGVRGHALFAAIRGPAWAAGR